MKEKILVFDLWGDYAHFKKPYTTTSPLSYSIPPRTTLTGILGAILGIEKNSENNNNILLNYSKTNISLSILSQIKKVNINQNLINSKNANSIFRMQKHKAPRTQIRVEYLKDVKYRVFIEIFDENLYKNLKDKLENHQAYYSISLGLSENLANFNYIGEYNYKEKVGDADIGSVINLERVDSNNIKIDMQKEYFSDRFPLEMKSDREVTKYGDILFERTGKTIQVKNSNYIELETGENIIWY